jgi:hypothetical protein
MRAVNRPVRTPLSVRPSPPERVLDHIPEGADVIVPMANGEAVGLIDALERHKDRLRGVRVHQMHALRPACAALAAASAATASSSGSGAWRGTTSTGVDAACRIVPVWVPSITRRSGPWPREPPPGRRARSAVGASTTMPSADGGNALTTRRPGR